MTRLATPDDAAYIAERLKTRNQVWSDEQMKVALTSPKWITVVDPPTGLFWLRQDEDDPTLLHAGITFSSGDTQTIAMIRLILSINPWPKWAEIEAVLDPTSCGAVALRAATSLVPMSVVAATGNRQTRRIKKTDVLKALGVNLGGK